MSTKHITEKAKAAMLIAILIILAALTSCKPVEYKELTADGIDSSVPFNGEAISNGSLISVSFKAIPGARSYGYTFPEGSDKPAPGVITDFMSGTYGMTINLYGGEEYSSVTIWASPYVDPSSASDPGWIKLKTIPVSREIPDINTVKPQGFISERTENSAIIVMTDEPFPGQMVYDVTAADNKEVKFTQDINVIYIEDISNEALTVTVRHAYKPADGVYTVFGTETESFDLEPADFKVFVDISVSEDGERIFISDPAVFDGYTEIKLVNIDNENDSYEITDVNDPFVFDRFDTGLFQIQAKKGDEADPSLASNIIQYTTPLSIFIDENKTEERSGRQHYWLSIPVAEGITASDFEAIIIENPSLEPTITISDGKASISFSDLSSVSDYTAVIAAGDSYYRDAFTTKSFEGTYKFNGAVKYGILGTGTEQFEFSLNVVLNENYDSHYKYYFYVSSEDPKQNLSNGIHISDETRICPLIDPAVDGDDIGNSEENKIDYQGSLPYQLAYQWNNEKWNTNKDAVVNFWYIDPSTPDIQEIDSYTTIVASNATLGMSTMAKTTTRFELIEDELGKANIEFFNKITGGDPGAAFGNYYLRKNKNPVDGDEYTFRLLQEEN